MFPPQDLLLDYQISMEEPSAAAIGYLSGTLKTKGDQRFSFLTGSRWGRRSSKNLTIKC